MATRTPSGNSKAPARSSSGTGARSKSTKTAKSAPASPVHDFPLPVRMIRSAWMGIARVVAGAFRKIGRDVHPPYEVRRDGTGLFLVILAMVIASVEWWGLRGVGWYGTFVHSVAGGTFGFMAAFMPPILLIGAIRLFRWPEEHRANNRVGIGLALLTVAGSGIAHVVGGIPALNASFDDLWAAGGVLGALATVPLAGLIKAPGAMAAMIALALLSLMILTATPLKQVPERIREGYDKLMGQDPDGTPAPTRRGVKLDAEEHDQSYLYEELPAAKKPRKKTRLFGKDRDEDHGRRGPAGQHRRGGLRHGRHHRRPRRADGPGPVGGPLRRIRRARLPGTVRPPRRAPAHQGRTRDGRDHGPGRPGPGARGRHPGDERDRPDQLRRRRRGHHGRAAGALASRRGPAAADPGAHRTAPALRRRHLHAALLRLPAGRPAVQGTLGGQRRGGRRAHRHPAAVQGRREGHRVLPRPDGHPLRDRAGPRHQGGARHRAVQEHLLRRGLLRRAHPVPDPGQVRDRHRDPQRGQGNRGARRRAAQPQRPQDRPPDGHGRGQGRRGRLRRRQPRQDAPPPGRRRHRRGQVLVRELDDHLDPDARHPGRGPHGHGRPQARGTHRLRGRTRT